LITGASNSGKTYAIGEFLQKCRSRSIVTFVEVVVVTLTGNQRVWRTFKKEYNATIVNPTEAFPEIERSSPGPRIIVFDDLMTADSAVTESVRSFFTNGRHHDWSCVFLTQHYFKCDLVVRANCNVNISFKHPSAKTARAVLRECQGRLDLDTLDQRPPLLPNNTHRTERGLQGLQRTVARREIRRERQRVHRQR
jgi:hypothetical protein